MATPSRVTSIGRREGRPNTSRLSSMEPATLVSIMVKASRGDTRDYTDLCDRLWWFDGHIRGTYGTRLAQVAAAPWEITPGTSRDAARQAQAEAGATFARQVLEELDAFDQAILDLADAIGVGWAVTEIDWDSIDGAEVPVDLRWLHPRRFTFGDSWDLRLTDDGETYVSSGVPLTEWPDKFVVHMPRLRGSYPGVAGCLRACCWVYLFRRWATQFWVRGVEKFAWPTLVGKVKRGAGAEVRDVMKAALRDAASDHYLVTEIEQEVAYLETLVKDAGSFAALDEALKAEASKAILGSTDQAEPIKVGAWKAVESRKGTTVDSRAAVDARQLSRTLRAQLLEPLMRFNPGQFGGVIPPTPEITFLVSGVRAPIMPAEIDAAIELARSGGLQPTEESIRDVAAQVGMTLERIPAGAPAPQPAPEGEPAPPAPQKRRPAARRRK